MPLDKVADHIVRLGDPADQSALPFRDGAAQSPTCIVSTVTGDRCKAVGVAKGLLIGATNPPEEEKKKGGKKKAPAAEAPAEDKGDDKKEAKKDDSGDDVADDAAVDAGEDSVEKSDDSAELSTVLAALQSSIDSVAQAVKAQGDANEGLSQRLDALDARIEKAEGDVRGTVHSEGNDDVSAPEGKAEARKWDNTLLDYGEGVEFA